MSTSPSLRASRKIAPQLRTYPDALKRPQPFGNGRGRSRRDAETCAQSWHIDIHHSWWILYVLTHWPVVIGGNHTARRAFMRTKRSASRLFAMFLMFAAIISPAVVAPASYHDYGVPSAATINLASSTSAYASLFSYHDY